MPLTTLARVLQLAGNTLSSALGRDMSMDRLPNFLAHVVL